MTSCANIVQGNHLLALQGQYQGVDWRDDNTRHCNVAEAPVMFAPVDTDRLGPMELMFVQVNSDMLLLKSPQALAAVMFDNWSDQNAAVCPQCGRCCTCPVHYTAPLCLPFRFEFAGSSSSCVGNTMCKRLYLPSTRAGG